MPWSGGVFTRENGPSPVFTGTTVWQQDAAASILIESTRHDFHDQDLADGINATLNTAGQNSPTANINWGGFKITNAGYGSGNNDYACYGQVPISAALNPSTNILTFTRPDGATFTVDLTSLVIGGSTANFAKLNATTNAFTGSATFAGTLECKSPLQTLDATSVSGSPTWTFGGLTPGTFEIANTAGAALDFTGNSGTATLKVNNSPVWTQATLTPAQVAGFVGTTGSYTFTGTYNFNAAAVILPSNVTFGASGTGWQTNTTTSALQLFAISSGATFQLDNGDTGSTARLLIGGNRAWNNGNMRVIASATPTGGAANDIAFVLTGANTGVWANIAGTWTKIAS